MARYVENGTLDAGKSVAGADLVIIATPVNMVVPTIKEIRRYLKPGCVVTDVASTKGSIVSGAEAVLGRNAMFVGGHPMAGSEKRGVDKAKAGLFNGSICLLTKTGKTDKRALQALVRFWRRLGAKVTVISPARHDMLICEVSHLPHIAAAVLCLSAGTAASFRSEASSVLIPSFALRASWPATAELASCTR